MTSPVQLALSALAGCAPPTSPPGELVVANLYLGQQLAVRRATAASAVDQLAVALNTRIAVTSI
jgi:hypothetical protein